MIDKLPGLGTILSVTKAIDDVVEPGFKCPQQVQTGKSTRVQSDLVIAPKRTFHHTVDPAGALLGTKLTRIIRFTFTATLAGTPMLTGNKSASLEGTLRCETAASL
jgi:hypothetical protein